MKAQAQVEGLDETLRAMRRMDTEGQKELRAEVQRITESHAAAVRSAGQASADPRVRHVATTVRAKKDRIPTILIGTAKRAPIRGNARAVDLVYGTEFGAAGRNWWKFEPGPQPWIFPTLSRRHRQVVSDWEQAVERIMKKWGD